MRILNLKAAWLVLLPMLAGGQSTDTPLPVRHETVEVNDTAPAVSTASSSATPVKPAEVKDLPSRPATVNDTLPLLPGIVRSPGGGLRINGSDEQRSALLVNQADVTDPATGAFGAAVPVDSVRIINVFRTPFLAQYGRFSSGVVAVETRRGGDKWHFELNDPFPDFRFRSWHIHGLQDATPRLVIGGPLIEGRLYFAQTVLYDVHKTPNRTLPFPDNTSTEERINSFTQLDYILSAKQYLTATLHLTPQHINFVNPDFFNPLPVTPSYRQQNYLGSVTDHLAVGHGMLESTVSIQRFDAAVGSQGPAPMFLLPQGSQGNYFANQNREAGRVELTETWSPAAIHNWGTHDLKFGSLVTQTSDSGLFTAKPIQIEDAAGQLLQRIDFTGGAPYSHYDLETTLFAQDHWSPAPTLALDLGARLERQSISETFRIAPRAGLSWMPFGGQRTVVQAGYGIFYDRVPLAVYAFDRFPKRVITNYAPDGTQLGPPATWLNLTGYTATPNSLLIHTENQPGNFAPNSATWNVHIEQTLSSHLKIRAGYTDTQSSGLILLNPTVSASTNLLSSQDVAQWGPSGHVSAASRLVSTPGVSTIPAQTSGTQSPATSALLLNGSGHSRYQAAEITAKIAWKGGQWFLAYTRSRSQGDLNEFTGFLGNYPNPLIRPNVSSNLPAGLPNRFLAWGTVKLPWRMQILPILEYRNGLPYSHYDVLGNYAGIPNTSRFPNFFSADARLMKDIQVSPKYTLRLSVSCNNTTNHFNALAVHTNLADPQNGLFFGNYPRRFRADFDVIF